RVGIRAPGDRDHRRQLRVAEPRRRAPQGGEQHRQDQGGPGVLRGRAREDKDASTDNRADPERRELNRSQRAPEGIPIDLGAQGAERFPVEDALHTYLYTILATIAPGERIWNRTRMSSCGSSSSAAV